MVVVVSLRDFVDEMFMLSDESRAFLNKATGELILITDEDLAFVEASDEDWSASSSLEAEYYQKVEQVYPLKIIWKFPPSLRYTSTKS